MTFFLAAFSEHPVRFATEIGMFIKKIALHNSPQGQAASLQYARDHIFVSSIKLEKDVKFPYVTHITNENPLIAFRQTLKILPKDEKIDFVIYAHGTVIAKEHYLSIQESNSGSAEQRNIKFSSQLIFKEIKNALGEHSAEILFSACYGGMVHKYTHELPTNTTLWTLSDPHSTQKTELLRKGMLLYPSAGYNHKILMAECAYSNEGISITTSTTGSDLEPQVYRYPPQEIFRHPQFATQIKLMSQEPFKKTLMESLVQKLYSEYHLLTPQKFLAPVPNLDSGILSLIAMRLNLSQPVDFSTRFTVGSSASDISTVFPLTGSQCLSLYRSKDYFFEDKTLFGALRKFVKCKKVRPDGAPKQDEELSLMTKIFLGQVEDLSATCGEGNIKVRITQDFAKQYFFSIELASTVTEEVKIFFIPVTEEELDLILSGRLNNSYSFLLEKCKAFKLPQLPANEYEEEIQQASEAIGKVVAKYLDFDIETDTLGHLVARALDHLIPKMAFKHSMATSELSLQDLATTQGKKLLEDKSSIELYSGDGTHYTMALVGEELKLTIDPAGWIDS